MKENQQNNEDREKLVQKLVKAAALVKLICGAGNNAAWAVTLDGYDHARRCKNYGYKVKQAFRQAIKEWHDYEHRLIYANENRMFHLADMTPEVRKMYGNISDREYYEFWASVGSSAYIKTRPLLNSLWNKHRLSLEHHGVKDAEHVAWVITAAASLDIAVQLYRRAIDQCVIEMQLPRNIVNRIFGQFDISRVADAWRRAILMLAPDSEYPLESLEKKNIEHGLTQLCDAWLSPDILYQSTMQSVEDYDEIFATHGYQKKAIGEIKKVQEATNKELNKQQNG